MAKRFVKQKVFSHKEVELHASVDIDRANDSILGSPTAKRDADSSLLDLAHSAQRSAQ